MYHRKKQFFSFFFPPLLFPFILFPLFIHPLSINIINWWSLLVLPFFKRLRPTTLFQISAQHITYHYSWAFINGALTSAIAKHKCRLLSKLMCCKYAFVMHSFNSVLCVYDALNDGPMTTTFFSPVLNLCCTDYNRDRFIV